MHNTPIATVYILVGLPFAGKTTYSKLLAERLSIPRISFDDEWARLEKLQTNIPGKNGLEQWRYVNTFCENEVMMLLKKGQSVVYDNMNNHIEHRERVKKMASESEAKSQILFIDIPLKEILRRRLENVSTKQRHQVTDENFNNALATFEEPTSNESPLLIRNNKDFGRLVHLLK